MSLYRELEVSPHATKEEIKKSYYKLVTKYHPDKNPDGEEKFRTITDAYRILTNDKEREFYDKTLRGTTPNIINNPTIYNDTTKHDYIRFTDKNPEIDMRKLILFRFKNARHRLYRRLVIGIVLVASLHATYSYMSQKSLKKIEDAYHENVASKYQLQSRHDSVKEAFMETKERERLQHLYTRQLLERERDAYVKKDKV